MTTTAAPPEPLAKSAPAVVPARLPAWADYVLVPLLNVTAAFLVAGLVVLLIGESPLRAVQILAWGALGYGEGVGDRKSTRLNSSHANISYAVFCLKKKTYFLFPIFLSSSSITSFSRISSSS